MGIALAFALICLLQSATFAQPATCHDTTANVTMVTFVLTGSDMNAGKTYMAVLNPVFLPSKTHTLTQEKTPAPVFYLMSAFSCTFLKSSDPNPMMALEKKQEITDPELKARLRQALLRQLSLYRKMILEETKR